MKCRSDVCLTARVLRSLTWVPDNELIYCRVVPDVVFSVQPSALSSSLCRLLR